MDQIDLCRITFSLSAVTLTLNLWKQEVVAIPVFIDKDWREVMRGIYGAVMARLVMVGRILST